MPTAEALVRVLPPQDIFDTLASIDQPVTATIPDPWYNRGIGGVRDDYDQWLSEAVHRTAKISRHIFVWGFPDIVCRVLASLPDRISLVVQRL